VGRGGKKEKKNGGVVGAAASASSSPTVSQNQYTGPSCTGCGIMIGKDVRALQCDRCCKQDSWKCIDCLDITGEVYDTLIECKELKWFCKGCSEEVSKIRGDREDRVLGILERVMEKLTDMEMRLANKVDVKEIEELEMKFKGLECNVNERVDKLEERIAANEVKLAQKEGVTSLRNDDDRDEQKEIELRQNNMIIYRVDEIDSEAAEDRKAGDALFVHEMCNDVLKVSMGTGDIEKMFRLGRREEGKVRPLLVRFSNVDKKASVMANVKELRTAPDRYKKISLAHDLTPRQREIVKDVRQKAIAEMSNEDTAAGNFRIIVVGQRTNKPRAIRVPLRE